jgi:two-component system, NarL family, invasion response regulator UvrY
MGGPSLRGRRASPVIRLLVADDHGVVRRGIVQIVSESPDIVVEGEASSGEEALELVRSRPFDVVVLDISMPGRGGLDVIRDMRAARPGIKIIVLSMHSEEQFAVRSLRDGASAYLTKSSADDELVPAVRAVAAGRRYITAEVADRLAYYVEADSELPPHERLGRREFQVLVLIGTGLTASQIADELKLSVKTISTYRSRIIAKTGLATNAQLIKYAIDHGLVT